MNSLRLTLRQLQVFQAVAEEGSTSLAAPLVALSQSATSAALNELERELGLELFDRVGKRLVLNANGRGLLGQARSVLDGAYGIQLWSDDTEAQAGQFRIGASTTIGNYLLPRMLAEFRRTLTEPRREAWRVSVMVANTAAVTATLARFELDLGLIEGPCHEAELDAAPWLEDELVIVAAPGDPILPGRGKRVPLAQLRAATWLLREQGSGTREIIDQALIPHLHQLREGIEFGNSEAIKRATAEGLGITCLSRSVVADFLAGGQLVAVPTTLPRLSRTLYLVSHKNKVATGGLALLRAHIEHYGKRRGSTHSAP